LQAHVLITDKDTYPVVRDNGFYGVGVKGIPTSYSKLVDEVLRDGRKPYFGPIGDLLGTRTGDIVFLYEMGGGFHGLYEVTTRPFFDPTPVGCVNGNYPIRIEIKCSNYFSEPVPEAYLFSTKEYESRFWVWFYRKMGGVRGGGLRGVNTINPEAADGLVELLVKVNGNAVKVPGNLKNYPSANKEEIALPLGRGDKPILEVILRAWIIGKIDDAKNEDLRKIFGPAEDLEWFANNVPYHISGNNIDILCYHRSNKYTGFPLRYRYSIVELKRGAANGEDVSQVIEYSKWVGGRLASSEIETVQPILIANDFDETGLIKAKNNDFSDRGLALYTYTVEDGNIRFDEVKL